MRNHATILNLDETASSKCTNEYRIQGCSVPQFEGIVIMICRTLIIVIECINIFDHKVRGDIPGVELTCLQGSNRMGDALGHIHTSIARRVYESN